MIDRSGCGAWSVQQLWFTGTSLNFLLQFEICPVSTEITNVGLLTEHLKKKLLEKKFKNHVGLLCISVYCISIACCVELDLCVCVCVCVCAATILDSQPINELPTQSWTTWGDRSGCFTDGAG